MHRLSILKDKRLIYIPLFMVCFSILLLDNQAKPDLDLPIIKLEIGAKNYNRIRESARKACLAKSMRGVKVFFNAFISHKKKRVPAKIRLKGDLVDHVCNPSKLSYRVVLKNGQTIMGMSQFSLMQPQARWFGYEKFGTSLFRDMGLLAPKYDFVELHINGRTKGKYSYEQFFTKQMLESQGRLESVFIKFNETRYWLTNIGDTDKWNSAIEVPDSEYEIVAFNHKFNRLNPKLMRYEAIGTNKLMAFMDGKLSMSDTFDVDMLAKHHALVDAIDAQHGEFLVTNSRFYYNPVTLLLEPVFFDGEIGTMGQKTMGKSLPFIPKRMKQEPEFLLKYYEYLWKYTDLQFFNRNIQSSDLNYLHH